MTVEHAFGILKGRWQALRDARFIMRTANDDARMILVMQACVVLHNLTISTWRECMTDQEMYEAMDDKYKHPKRQQEADNMLVVVPNERRREELVDEMLALEPDEIDLMARRYQR